MHVSPGPTSSPSFECLEPPALRFDKCLRRLAGLGGKRLALELGEDLRAEIQGVAGPPGSSRDGGYSALSLAGNVVQETSAGLDHHELRRGVRERAKTHTTLQQIQGRLTNGKPCPGSDQVAHRRDWRHTLVRNPPGRLACS